MYKQEYLPCNRQIHVKLSDKDVDSGRKECPLRYGGAGFRFGRRETPEIFGCDYLAVEMDDGDISFPFISMR